jgi:ketosteroid isomerase-like protein
MRFEIRETVHAPDPELVLRALEVCSREVSNDVVRFGDQITLRGLGPSPRTKNAHDMTVFSVNVEDDTTIISGEVKFQASALLGDQPQCDVMRSKLDDLFEQMKAKIRLDEARAAAAGERRGAVASSAAVDDAHEADQSSAQETVAVAPEGLIEALDAAPEMGWMAAAVVGGAVGPVDAEVGTSEAGALGGVEVVAQPQEAIEDADVAEVGETNGAGVAPQNEESSATGLEGASGIEQGAAADEVVSGPELVVAGDEAGKSVEASAAVAPEPGAASEAAVPSEPTAEVKAEVEEEPALWAVRTVQEDAAEGEASRSGGWRRSAPWLVGVSALLAIVAGCYFFLFANHRGGVADRAAEGTVPAAGTVNPVPTARTAPEPAPSTPVNVPGANADSIASTADLKAWVQGWAVAMRTRDADAQAAYYAKTVDLYEGHRDVSRDAVLKDREATIRMRKGLWTVKMENIVVVRQTATEAEVRLVKHFMDQPAQSEILESFVPTRLVLKKTDEGWKISSEQDLTSPQRAEALSVAR